MVTPFELSPISCLNGSHQNFNGPELGHLRLVPRQMLNTANEKIIRYCVSNALPLNSVINMHGIVQHFYLFRKDFILTEPTTFLLPGLEMCF